MQNNLKRAMDTNLRSLLATDEEQAAILRNCLEGCRARQRVSVAFVVTVILILLAATALAVTAITGHLRFMKPEEGPQPVSCTVMNDTLYMLTNDGLMQWVPDDADPEMLLNICTLQAQGISIRSLLFHTDVLMLLDTNSHTIWGYDNGTFAQVLALSDIAAQMDARQISNPVALDGILFFLAVGDNVSEMGTVLWRIDLSTGKKNALAIRNVIELAAYRDGQLLAIQRNMPEEYDALIAIDMQSGEIEREITFASPLEIEGIAYNSDSNTIYAIRGGSLSQWANSQWVPLQTVSIPQHSFFYGTIGDGYVAAGYWGVQFVNLGTSNAEPVLVIRGWPSPLSAEDAFVQANPGIQIKRETLARFSGTDIAAALQSDDSADLFYVRLDAAVVRLIRDGLLAPLSGSVLISADIARMLPQIQAAVAPSGTAYALPETLSIPLWMIRNDAADPQPRTLVELLRQDIAWNAEPHSGAMYLANDYNALPWTKNDYARYALNQAFEEAETGGQTPDFSASEFTEFLELLKGADLSAAAQPVQSSVVTANSAYMLRGRSRDEALPPWHIIEPPAVTAAETDSISAMLLVYVLNPNAKHMQLAIDFLEYQSQHRNPQEQAFLSPDTAEPSLYAYVQEYPGLELLPDSWEVEADALAVYQTDIAPRLSVSFSPYSPNQSSMLETILQYLNGGITLEQCAAQLNALVAGEAAE